MSNNKGVNKAVKSKEINRVKKLEKGSFMLALVMMTIMVSLIVVGWVVFSLIF